MSYQLTHPLKNNGFFKNETINFLEKCEIQEREIDETLRPKSQVSAYSI